MSWIDTHVDASMQVNLVWTTCCYLYWCTQTSWKNYITEIKEVHILTFKLGEHKIESNNLFSWHQTWQQRQRILNKINTQQFIK